MELRDDDLELRPWTLDDVPAIVEACNDAEIQHWIPVIPRPYTEEDAGALVRGECLESVGSSSQSPKAAASSDRSEWA